MGKKCSHCGNIGHNSRTCTNYKMSNGTNVVNRNGVRLFGVQLDIHSSSCSCSTYSSSIAMKKSFSMDCLPCSSSASSSSPFSSLSSSSRVFITEGPEKTGYLSAGHLGYPKEKKKGVPWSKEEHKAFLAGLEKLGKGDWKGISRNFVPMRSPTQVASHAQKYFLRQSTLNCKKRRSSLFDMVSSDTMGDHQVNYSITKLRSSDLEENNQDYNFTQPSSPNQVMHVGLFDPLPSPKVNSCPVIASPTNEAPDLELKLGASRLANQDKSPSNSLLIESITVV